MRNEQGTLYFYCVLCLRNRIGNFKYIWYSSLLSCSSSLLLCFAASIAGYLFTCVHCHKVPRLFSKAPHIMPYFIPLLWIFYLTFLIHTYLTCDNTMMMKTTTTVYYNKFYMTKSCESACVWTFCVLMAFHRIVPCRSVGGSCILLCFIHLNKEMKTEYMILFGYFQSLGSYDANREPLRSNKCQNVRATIPFSVMKSCHA